MKYFLFILCLMTGVSANSQTILPIEKPSSTPENPMQDQLFANIRIGLFYSMADKISMSGKVSSTSVSDDEGTSGQFGLLVEDRFEVDPQSVFTLGFSYEFSRTVNTYSATDGTNTIAGTYTSKPKMNIGNLYGNYGYKISPGAEIYGGLGYSIFTMENSNATVRGTFGYQIGMNYELRKNKFMLLEYRCLKATGESVIGNTSVTIDSANFNGLLFGLKMGI